MTAEEFYYNIYYGIGISFIDYNDAFQFAEAYAEQQNKELRSALELALEAIEEAQLMGDFSDDIEAIKEVLNKER